MCTGIYLAYMKVGIRNRLTGFHKTYYDIADILTYLIFLFYFETGVKQLNGNIMILFSSRLFLVDLL